MKKLLLLGDSLIEFFNWQERFPSYEVTNAGVAGETVQGLLRRIRHSWPEEVSPHWISIMIDTNNLTMEDLSSCTEIFRATKYIFVTIQTNQ